ncbi:MAG: AraC family transcriptional regulator [Saprospiraceae bacterium]|nr:MAG: AraC family transcriptional regulator [Saprospiraceae bacterium]
MTELILNIGKPYERFLTKSNQIKTIRSSHFIGIKSQFTYVKPNPEIRAVIIRFKPGAIRMFVRCELDALTDEVVEADQVFGKEIHILEQKIAEETDNHKIFEQIESFLLSKIRFDTEALRTIDDIKLIYKNPIYSTIEDFQLENFSYKNLERRFKKNLGLTPKLFMNIVKFNYSSKLLTLKPLQSLTQTGYESGYFDQAHFIKAFKRFSGFTPKEYPKQNSQILQKNQQTVNKLFEFISNE